MRYLLFFVLSILCFALSLQAQNIKKIGHSCSHDFDFDPRGEPGTLGGKIDEKLYLAASFGSFNFSQKDSRWRYGKVMAGIGIKWFIAGAGLSYNVYSNFIYSLEEEKKSVARVLNEKSMEAILFIGIDPGEKFPLSVGYEWGGSKHFPYRSVFVGIGKGKCKLLLYVHTLNQNRLRVFGSGISYMF